MTTLNSSYTSARTLIEDMTSRHLENLIARSHGSAHLQVVFVDMVGYQKMGRTAQFAVIRHFTSLVNESLRQLGQRYSGYAKLRDVDFNNDVVKMATGNGLTLVFTFDEIPGVASDFSSY